MSSLSNRLSPAALVVSIIALVMAMAGGAVAASKLISGKKIKDGTITANKLKNRTLTGKQIRGGSLSGKQIHSISSEKVKPGLR